MSSPSFIDRIRSRSRRPEQAVLLDTAPGPLLQTSPSPLPEDHWHAGDPRLAQGSLLLAGDVPSPRRPVDRRRLTVVPEVDLRAEVLDLTGARPQQRDAAAAAATPPPAPSERTPVADAPCTEPSTWLG